MAALGTAQILAVPDFLTVDTYTASSGSVAFGSTQILAVPDFIVTSGYGMAGTSPLAPAPPTTGQIWPRGKR
jgi:hypothetical protein